MFEKLYINYLTWAKMLGEHCHLEDPEVLGSLGVCAPPSTCRRLDNRVLSVGVGTRLHSWCSVEYSTSILASPRENTGPTLTSPGTAFRRLSSGFARNPVGKLIAKQHSCLQLAESERYESARIFYVTAMRRIHRAIYPVASKRADWSETASSKYETPSRRSAYTRAGVPRRKTDPPS